MNNTVKMALIEKYISLSGDRIIELYLELFLKCYFQSVRVSIRS